LHKASLLWPAFWLAPHEGLKYVDVQKIFLFFLRGIAALSQLFVRD